MGAVGDERGRVPGQQQPRGAAQAVGRYGERVAAAHLQAAGLVVLDRNWRCRWGELDLVVRDGDCVVGVEVKARRSATAGSSLEAITPAKVARLRRLLGHWLEEHRLGARDVRLDAVAVVCPRSGQALVEHVRGIG